MVVPVGLNVWSRLVETTFPYLDRTAAPFDSLWMPDHVQYAAHPVAEGWSLLAWAMARYPDKVCGHEVLCNSFRNPGHLAKMGATLQALSGGRFVLGIGAGWNEEEYRAYGWPFPPARVRIAQLAEAITLIRAMWSQAPVHHKGEHYQVDGAFCEPRPRPVPPVMVGGHGERYLLRVVAQHADWWNYPFRDFATYAQKQEALKGHCRDVGRDYDAIQQVVRVSILIGDTEREVERLKARPDTRPLSDIRVFGTPEQVTETLLGIVARGARYLTVNFADVPRPEGTWLFAATVLPHLRAA
ncbi:MAG TPA: LLM class flavin-dependent oxidoreductase [Methylomirabilota bacterium]|jgi:alkanesulfonate monooxygenase SsuD/methylene tetrahydromethanopterin reductase-like flavin-dependent oxidoreductase (luciferase family)|nr:LLM class flavin-dependent oxidoreductase [Methylomirabilota bacterium]